jgi:hypothetical protein
MKVMQLRCEIMRVLLYAATASGTFPEAAGLNHVRDAGYPTDVLRRCSCLLKVCHTAVPCNITQGPGVYSASNRNEYQKHKNNVSGE